MLKVTLHYATPATVSARNILGKLDIGYLRLDAVADYKGILFSTSVGEQAPVQLLGYPRWSASVWDLIARIVCLSLNRSEELWQGDLGHGKKGAFIDDMTAVIEHWPDGTDARRATVGTAHVHMHNRRCNYTATFEDDILGKRESSIFVHAPQGLTPWDLLARAYAWTVQERFELPPRPTLYTPIPIEHDSVSYIPLDTVSEPAYTGVSRWLTKMTIPVKAIDLIQGPCVTEAQFVAFLRTAV